MHSLLDVNDSQYHIQMVVKEQTKHDLNQRIRIETHQSPGRDHEHTRAPDEFTHQMYCQFVYPKRKPPCIGGMELVSLSFNRVFISAESVGRG